MPVESSPRPVASGLPLKPLSALQLANMAVGFLGIQFAWSIQMAQMSPIYKGLGANDSQFSVFWMAGPITGILVQPIIGSWSDRTWSRLGRRRPFFLAGAFLTAATLCLIPNVQALTASTSAALIMAALLLWVLDASINTSMGPYRALIPDIAPPSQHAMANAYIGFAIGAGAAASFWVGGVDAYSGLANLLGAESGLFRALHSIAPTNTHLLFYLGALTIVAAILYTVLTTREHPPEEPAAVRPSMGFGRWFLETWQGILHMPREMAKLCLVQFFTWFGLFCLFIFFSVYVAENVFHATPGTPVYETGMRWASLSFLTWNIVCFAASFAVGWAADRLGRKPVHTLGLVCMTAAYLIFFFTRSPFMAMLGMGVLGIGWATTVTVPYAMLAGMVPKSSEGALMGAFNIFICLPQLLCAATMGFLVDAIGPANRPVVFAVAGVCSVAAAFALQWVKEDRSARSA